MVWMSDYQAGCPASYSCLVEYGFGGFTGMKKGREAEDTTLLQMGYAGMCHGQAQRAEKGLLGSE